MEESLIDLIRKVLKCDIEKVHAYLIGDVIALACTREDLIRAFRAIGEPPYVPLDKILETCRRKPSIAVHDCTIVLSDIAHFEDALVLASRIAKELTPYMPFKISHVDLVLTYRSSEDGGLFTRYAIKIYIVRSYCQEVLQEVRHKVEEIVNSIFSSEEGSSTSQ